MSLEQQELATLRAELAALAAAHAALVARVDQAPPLAPTMAKHLRCPACGCTKIAQVDTVMDRGDGNVPQEMALASPSIWSSKVVGKLGCCACTKCRLVEWYVRAPETLREVAGKITITDSATSAPYR